MYIIEEIEDFVLHSTKIPIFNKLIIDEERLFLLLDSLRNSLPDEIQESINIVANRDSIINGAANKAKEILLEAGEKAKRIVENSEIIKQSKIEADLIRKEAFSEIETKKEDADIYADQVLEGLQNNVIKSLQIVQNGIQELSVSKKSK